MASKSAWFKAHLLVLTSLDPSFPSPEAGMVVMATVWGYWEQQITSEGLRTIPRSPALRVVRVGDHSKRQGQSPSSLGEERRQRQLLVLAHEAEPVNCPR